MAMSVQEWRNIELSRRWREIEGKQYWRGIDSKPYRKETRKPVDAMVYPAVLAILGVIGTMVLFVYAIRTVNEHLPHRPAVNLMYSPQGH